MAAYQLNLGTTGYGIVPDLGQDPRTIQMWIKPSSVSGDYRLLGQATGSPSQSGAIAINQASGETGSLWIWDGSAWHRLAPNNTLSAGSWYFINIAWIGVGMVCSVNNSNVGSTTGSNLLGYNGVNVSLCGLFVGTYGGTFRGVIDEVRFLSAYSDGSTEYNSGAGRYGSSSDSNLIAGYHFDEGSGSTANDYTTGSRNATLYGSPSYEAGEKAIEVSTRTLANISSISGLSSVTL